MKSHLPIVVLPIALAFSGCAMTQAKPTAFGQDLSQCAGMLVIGRVERLDSVPTGDQWTSWNTYRLHIKDVLRGDLHGRTVEVQGTSHADVREDIDFLWQIAEGDSHLVLKRGQIFQPEYFVDNVPFCEPILD